VHNSPLQISGQTRDPIGLRPICNSIFMFYTYFIIIILYLLDPRRNTNEHYTYHKNNTKYYTIFPNEPHRILLYTRKTHTNTTRTQSIAKKNTKYYLLSCAIHDSKSRATHNFSAALTRDPIPFLCSILILHT
jgi:hypothetical protein